MKRILVVLVFLILLLPLMASGLQKAVNDMYSYGKNTQIEDNKVFMSSTYWTDKYYQESGALDFVALAAYYFLAVHHKWDTMSDEDLVSKMESTDCIGCPWTNGYGEALFIMQLSEIYSNFSSNSYDEMGETDLRAAIRTFVSGNADRESITYGEEDEE